MNAGVSTASANSSRHKQNEHDSIEPYLNNSRCSIPSSFPSLAELEAAGKTSTEGFSRENDSCTTLRKRATGLEDALKIIRGEKDSSVLGNTRQSWQQFKCKDGIREELDNYKKDKNRFTDKVAFLERSDLRQWEHEQQGRKSRR